MKKSINFKPLKKIRLYEEVADKIKKAIFAGELLPGEQLPSERDLAEMFKVGRPTIREALRTLSVLGLVESNAGFKGALVKEIDLGKYLDAMGEQFSWMIQADKSSFEEMWEARTYLELGIAHSVAQNASDKEIQDLFKYTKKMEQCSDANDYFAVAIEFHLKLAELSGNRIFYMTYKLICNVIRQGYPILTKMYPDRIATLQRVNIIMLEAIQTRDAEKINKAMQIHAREE